MSRPLTPFVRHLGEAKHRLRQLQLSVDRVCEAAIATAGCAGDAGQLDRAISIAHEQLRLLEGLATRWTTERNVVLPARGAALHAEIIEFLER